MSNKKYSARSKKRESVPFEEKSFSGLIIARMYGSDIAARDAWFEKYVDNRKIQLGFVSSEPTDQDMLIAYMYRNENISLSEISRRINASYYKVRGMIDRVSRYEFMNGRSDWKPSKKQLKEYLD